MNWLAQNWLWIVFGVFVLAVFNRGTRFRRRALSRPDSGRQEIIEQADAAIDPVTHKAISTAGAATSVYQGRIYYFESAESRQRFEASPAQYAREAPTRRTTSAGEGQRSDDHRHGGGCC